MDDRKVKLWIHIDNDWKAILSIHTQECKRFARVVTLSRFTAPKATSQQWNTVLLWITRRNIWIRDPIIYLQVNDVSIHRANFTAN